jgi:2'-5' RNA ligase
MVTSLSKNVDAQIRTFLAIELPSTVRDELASITSALAAYRPILKVVAPDAHHLTVRFIGGIPAGRVEELKAGAAEGAAGATVFSLALSRPGTFPERGGVPRVVWVGLQQDDGYAALQGLFQAVERELTGRGFPPERRAYAPHLTIARVRDDAPGDLARRLGDSVRHLASTRPVCASFEVSHLTVMRSDLGRTGPTYMPLARIPLATKGADR